MPVTININGLTLVHKGSGGVSAATLPDVCLTPPVPTPIPYPNISLSSDLTNGSQTVWADGGNMIAVKGSKFATSTGDEAGTAGGVVSGTNMKESTWISYSFDVRVEGKNVCRLTDKKFQNHKNTVNLAGVVQPPLPIYKAKDCKELAGKVQEGDIVLRSTPGGEGDLLRNIAKCDYTHAGIVTKNAKGDLVVTDAYPRAGGAVDEETVESFFCSHQTTGGMVSRPKDQAAAKKAATWARKQMADKSYEFDIFNGWNQDSKKLYCSDFVYQSFQQGGVDLVPTKMDFLSKANKANTFKQIRAFDWKARLIGDGKLEKELLKKAGTSEYITPCAVAKNASTNVVASWP